MAQVSIAIEGMHCQNCVAAVFNKLNALPGIDSVEVNLDKGEAVLTGSEINMDAVRVVIGDLGFDSGESRNI